jgi:hypothetical protein
MLFQEILNEKYRILKPEFDKLFQTVLNKQTHPGDLLLTHQNGFYNPEIYEWDNIKEKYTPYMIGPWSEGHSEDTHYSFIGNYVNNNIRNESLSDYLERVKYNPEKAKEVDELHHVESISIQTEMLIYLKVWEADSFIKTFYELALLLNGEPYDWHFKIKESFRDKEATGNRDTIIRELIRDKFKSDFPLIYEAFKKAFVTQVRNAIAHSQYIISQGSISLNNHIKSDPSAQLKVISFDRWIDIFHETIIIHSIYHEFLRTTLNYYEDLSILNNHSFEVRINMLFHQKETKYWRLRYDPHFKIWGGSA